MKYNENEKTQILDRINDYASQLLNQEFDELSNNQMAWLKCVSLSSIMTMKKVGYNNDKIMTTFGHAKKDPTEKAKELLSTMTDEQLAGLGLSRV